jgi:FMN phosphatase YigB (HAD superfamily)
MKTILVDAVWTFVSTEGVIDQKMFDLLETYPNKKIIVTNANDEEIPVYGLDKVPYEVFTMKHNPDKTDPKFFQSLFDHYGLSINDIIYFEHTPKAVEAAQSLGIVAYRYDENKKDLVELKNFLDTNL